MSDGEHDFKLVAIRCTHCPARYWVADRDMADESVEYIRCTGCGWAFTLRNAEVIYRQGQNKKAADAP